MSATINPDFTPLDRPEILQFVFYPRNDWTPTPPGASDFQITVAPEVDISVRRYGAFPEFKDILYFHGNGEVACDYDYYAQEYIEIGANLLVADYRGYGRSGGIPTLSSTVGDSLKIFDSLYKGTLSYGPKPIIMGRSLGSMSALTIASQRPDDLSGLIIESGFPAITRVLRHLGLSYTYSVSSGLEKSCLDIVSSILSPTLVIHGSDDELIPFSEGQLLYQTLSSKVKTLLTVAGAGHNDILLTGKAKYYNAIGEFIKPLH